MPDTAVIVAAGLSSRLYPLTTDLPKALLPLGPETLLSRSIRLLKQNGISQVAVVVGFQADVMREAIGRDAILVSNPFYRHCNNMGSLYFAREIAGDHPFVYLHGDLAYTGRMLAEFLRVTRSSNGSCLDLLTAYGEVDEEAMKVRVDDTKRLVESSKSVPLEEAAGEWTGIAVVHESRLIFEAIEQHMMKAGLNDYDTAAFTSLVAAGNTVRCIPSNGDPWKEIDTIDDLQAARAAFGGRT
jgi:choline kinase